jgi:uncharacterized protein YkwD
MRRLIATGLMLLALGGAMSPAQAAPDLESDDDQAEAVLELVNDVRADAGCGPLKRDPRLEAAALKHAHSMARDNFFSHEGKDGSRVGKRVTAQGYTFQLVGENISAGYPTAEETMDGWMKSPGHRANILTCAYMDIGVAYVYQRDDRPIGNARAGFHHYWVQVFGLELKRP